MIEYQAPKWVKRSQAEENLARFLTVLPACGLDVLFGLCLWVVLVRVFAFLNWVPANNLPGYVAFAVAAVILPSAWYDSRRALGRQHGTLICEHCNTVKLADAQTKCSCGGCFRPLAEMKWIESPVAPAAIFPRKPVRQSA